MSLIFLLFPIIGIVLTVFGIKGLNRYKKLPKVEAKIIDYNKRKGDNGTLYSAIYSYTFNGEFINGVCSNLYTSAKPKVGSIKEIAVNPEHPEVPIARGSYTILLFIGITFIIVSSFIVPVILDTFI